jgi:hypothetical protein
LSAKWQQSIGYASRAPISLPTGRQASTCLRRSGYAQAGQIANNIQIPISNEQNGFVSEFGHLVIGNYWNLGFGYWDFNACLIPAMPG